MRQSLPFAIVALLLAGCGDPEPLPPSGVQGPIILHQWRDDGRLPLVVVAHQLIQGDDGGFSHLELEAVLVRMPFAQGTLFIAAPRASYATTADDASAAVESGRFEVRLHGDARARLKVSGEIQGEPLIGTAEEAWFVDGALNLSKVELCVAGRLQTAEHVHVVKDSLYQFTGHWAQTAPPAGLHAVLAALPRPLHYPEFRRGDFAD